MPQYLELGVRERWVVTGKVHYGGFEKPTSNRRGSDDRGENREYFDAYSDADALILVLVRVEHRPVSLPP
jgi:hypothetical protein